MESTYEILNRIEEPADLQKLTQDELIGLSRELRAFIIEQVSANPGHLGASLGVTELTIALHYVNRAPYDQIIWDVGHQAYGHKILTGRKSLFHTNRKYKGISGFPKPSESPYDAFGVGHASTSISAALGIALASKHKGEKDKKITAVIGDGALTGGLAFEGLNNAGIEHSDILVILNDNNIAIDPSVGAIKEYLLDIATSRTYNKLKNEVWNIMGVVNKIAPDARKYLQQIENGIKSILLKQSNLFEALNFRYFGPVDGHDLPHLIQVLDDLRNIPGPKLLHVLTKKGKGFPQAEENQTAFHSPGRFDIKTGKLHPVHTGKPVPPRYQDVFGETLLELAKENKKIVGITPAMPTGSSMKIAMDELPERMYDVGIAEQHAVTFAAGLAIQGMVPFCNVYSSFLQRAYDQVIHDVALQELNVVFCLDRAGLVGGDGATHHGAFDLTYLRCIPNLTIAAPMNAIELRNMLYTAQLRPRGPFAIRYPRGRGLSADWRKEFDEIPVGKGRQIKEGSDIAILALGHTSNFALEASEKLEEEQVAAAVFDMRFLKPLDEQVLHQVFKSFDRIITIEDGVLKGGFGSAILEFMSDNAYQARIKRLGIPDRFIDHGTQQELYAECGYDVHGICQAARSMVRKKVLHRAG